MPQCISATREMDFRLITSFDDLETVYMDLKEPIVDRQSRLRKEKLIYKLYLVSYIQMKVTELDSVAVIMIVI